MPGEPVGPVVGEGVVVVAPLVEALLLHAVRRRGPAVAVPRPTRLVSEPYGVQSVGYAADRTSVLLLRPGADLEVLPAGSLVLPSLLGRGAPTYVVLTHDPVAVWLRIGPFETLDARVVQQVELRLTVAITGSPVGVRDLAEQCGATRHGGLAGLGQAVVERLAREVAARTTEAVRRRTLAELTALSLGVLLDESLPVTFLGGLVDRSDLAVVDVDWPTEGRGWTVALAPGTGEAAGTAGAVAP